MGLDVSKVGAERRSMALQDRIIAAAHPVTQPRTNKGGGVKTPWEMFWMLRNYLLKAVDDRIITNPPHHVYDHLATRETNGGALLIAVGNVRNFKRDRTLPHFCRKDGGWFDFQLEVAARTWGVEVLWYDFELRLPEGSPIPFVRLDLNPVDHTNVERARRSHLHLGSDDDGWSVPMAVLSPYEALDLFLHGLKSEGRVRRLGT